jgi:TolA-binding protein
MAATHRHVRISGGTLSMVSSFLLLSLLSASFTPAATVPDANSPTAQTQKAIVQPKLTKLEVYRQEADQKPGSPESLDALRKLALEYLQMCHKTEAIAACREMAGTGTLSEDARQAIVTVAHKAYGAGDYVTARSAFAIAGDRWTASDEDKLARTEFVILHIAAADEAAAQRQIDLLWNDVKNDEKGIPVILDVAEAYEMYKGPEAALSLYRQMAERWPENLAAVKTFESRRVLRDDDVTTQRRLGVLLADGGKAACTAAHATAEAYLARGRNAEAYAVFSSVAAKRPKTELALLATARMASIDIQRGDAAKAEAAIRQLRQDFGGSPKLSRAMMIIADAYRQAGRLQGAKALYEYISQNWPGGKEAARARIWSKTVDKVSVQDFEGGVDAAVTDSNDVATLDEGLFEVGRELQEKAAQTLGKNQIDDGRILVTKAAKVWDVLHKRCTGSRKASASYALGESCRFKGEYKDACTWYELSVEEAPMGKLAAASQFMAGECYRMLKEQKGISESEEENKMVKAYLKVLEDYPGCRLAQAAKARLSQVAGMGEGGVR